MPPPSLLFPKPSSIAKAPDVAAATSFLGANVSSLYHHLRCCQEADPEHERAGRCKHKAAQPGWCQTSAAAIALCPVACGSCTPCLGRCSVIPEPPPPSEWIMVVDPASGLPRRANSLIDDAWCSSYPRCAIFQCCDVGARECFRPSRQQFSTPPPVNPFGRTVVQTAPLDVTSRAAQPQTRSTLEAGLAALPFTTPSQFEQLSTREEFRILYIAQGASPKKLPKEYAVLRRSWRQFMFVAFREQKGGGSGGGGGAHASGADADAFFPKSTIGEGRNMMYLLAREREIAQGWLFDYIVMLDDDLEFEVFDPDQIRHGKPHLRELGLIAYAKLKDPTPGKSRVKWREALHEKLYEFETWLRFRQPAVGVLCWGASGCREPFWHTATCHADHKIVAYHREALETLLPMPTHRDKDCWWASQWATNTELSLFYRGHWLYYPGSLRVRDVWGPGAPARYEQHARYPREGCGTNGSDTGAFMRITHDLIALAARHAWPNQTAHRTCFAPLIHGCLRRWQGALDGPALPKDGPYYWQPPWSPDAKPGRSVVEPPCE